jgi:hypothetical protein
MKNFILKALAWLNTISFLLSACALDCDEVWPWPSVICSINLAWLALFGYANNWFDDYEF